MGKLLAIQDVVLRIGMGIRGMRMPNIPKINHFYHFLRLFVYINEDSMDCTLDNTFDINDRHMHTSIFSDYLKEIGQYPILTREDEVDLFQKMYAGDIAAKEKLIQCNLRLVVSVIKKYTNISSDMEIMDVIQEGNLGLMRALKDFDYTRGNKFSTYATFWIRQAALRGIHDKGYMIRIPIHYQEKQYQLYQTKEKLIKELHREPTLKEISSDTGISEKLLKEYEAQQGIRMVGSLDAPLNLEKEESETFGDFIADTDQNIEEIAEQKELEELILQCLDNLTDKEKNVIKMRFGFNGEEPMTLEAVGNRLGVTRERIRQIEAKSIRKLRNYKTRLLLEDYIP